MSKARFADWSLSKKVLVLVTVAATLPLAVGVGLLAGEARGRVREGAGELLAARADQLTAQLDAFHRRYRGLARYLARVGAERLQNEGAPQAATASMAAMQSILQIGDGARAAILIDRNGLVVESSDAVGLRTNVAYRTYFQRAMQGEVFVSDIFIPPVGETAALIGYAAPIHDKAANIIGVAALFIRAEAFWDLVRANRGHAGAGSFALVYDRHGVRIAHGMREDFHFRPASALPDAERDQMVREERFGARTADLLGAVISTPEQFAIARSPALDNNGTSLLRTFSAANGVWNLTLPRRLHEVPWTIFIVVPEASIYGGVDQLLERTLVVSLIILGIALWGGWYLARGILRPVQAIGAAAMAVEHGNLGVRVPDSAGDEIGVLGKRFNDMAAALETSRAEIESRVHQRTEELEKANQELRTQREELLTQRSELQVQQVELERKNQEVLRADRLKSEFLANMSHELRTPLNSIIGFSELLIEEARDDLQPSHRQYLEDVFNSGKHLLRVINDILDLSKIEAGYVALDPSVLEPSDIIAEACQILAPVAAKREVSFQVTIHATQKVWADRAKLLQVLLNLLSNAVKFSNERSCVEISTEDAAAFVRFVIADHGPGIEETVQQKLFQPFVQGEHPLVKRHQGTGLGLVISKRLVEQHGGTIELQSRVGTGTTLRFSIPAAGIAVTGGPGGDIDQTSARVGVAAVHALHYSGAPVREVPHRITVLVVDDHDLNRELIRSVLERRGRRVLQAKDGAEGVALARAHRPDIVLMDLAMPNLDGLTATQQLRDDPSTRRIPIVALTAMAMRGDEDRARAAGADDYLTKPIDRKRLEETVDRLLATGRIAS
ncbi:MAG TPA: response regulator [Polyangia bacterium]